MEKFLRIITDWKVTAFASAVIAAIAVLYAVNGLWFPAGIAVTLCVWAGFDARDTRRKQLGLPTAEPFITITYTRSDTLENNK